MEQLTARARDYRLTRDNGLCPGCRKPNPSPSVYCADCLQARGEEYRWYKDNGVCVCCHSENAVPGNVLCLNCAEQKNAAKRRPSPSPERRIETAAYQKSRRQRLKSAGLCVDCGKLPAYEREGKPITRCYSCYIKQRQSHNRQAEKRNLNYRAQGLCIWCGAEPSKGRNICPDCLERCRKAAAHARQFIER